LDYSPAMKAYFGLVETIIVRFYRLTAEEARELVNRYFALDVHPLERALVMHCQPEKVADELVQSALVLKSIQLGH
jgi:hypothetical protein